MFPPLLTQLALIGEESGALDAMLSRAAEIIEADIDTTVATLSALLEPALELAKEGGSPRAANVAMVGVMAALGGFGLPDAAYREAIAANFPGKEKVVAQNEAVFALAKRWGEKQTP